MRTRRGLLFREQLVGRPFCSLWLRADGRRSANQKGPGRGAGARNERDRRRMAAGARSADLGPGAVWIAAGSAAHGLRSTVDVDAMNEIAAAGGPAIVEVLDNHLAVA